MGAKAGLLSAEELAPRHTSSEAILGLVVPPDVLTALWTLGWAPPLPAPRPWAWGGRQLRTEDVAARLGQELARARPYVIWEQWAPPGEIVLRPASASRCRSEGGGSDEPLLVPQALTAGVSFVDVVHEPVERPAVVGDLRPAAGAGDGTKGTGHPLAA